jgi:hypothetical protein
MHPTRSPDSPSGNLKPQGLTTWLILVYTGIYFDILRTPLMMSYMIMCYHITQYENQGNRISHWQYHIILIIVHSTLASRYIRLAKSISLYMSRYTIIRVTQYMSVYPSMKFSDKVYTCMY